MVFKSAHILRRISEMPTFFPCRFLHDIIISRNLVQFVPNFYFMQIEKE